MSAETPQGMSASQARKLEYSIIGLCVAALVSIFQPFSQFLFSAGCVGVVVAGLAFNLMPFCRPGVSFGQIGKVLLIVMVVFAVVVALALASALAYSFYLKN
jgi:small-conductance mechanosensitive channel